MQDLKEFSTQELLDELDRRILQEVHGCCAYCEQSVEEHNCKHTLRADRYHSITDILGWMVDTNISLETFVEEKESDAESNT